MKKLLCAFFIFMLLSGNVPVKFNSYARYDASEYKLTSDDINAASKNARILNRLASKAMFNQKKDIYLPKGTFYIDSSTMGVKCIGVKNLSFIGDGTVLVNTSYDNKTSSASVASNMFFIENSTNISIEGVSFDYLNRCSINGIIQSSNGGELVIKLDSDFAQNQNYADITGGEMAAAVNEIDYSNGASVISDTYFAEDSKTTYDKKTRVFCIKNTTGYNLFDYKQGNTAVIRCSDGNNIAPMFVLNNTKGFALKNVNVYSCPGATVYGSYCGGDFEFDNFCIAPRSGSGQIYSSNVDGIHLNNQTGNVTLNDCNFRGMGDDSLNVNSQAGKICDGDGINLKLKYARDDTTNLSRRWAKKGDVLKFYDNTWKLVATAKVKSFRADRLKLQTKIPYTGKSLYVQNTRLAAKININNTTVDTTRARAFLIRSDRAKITNCTIQNTALAGIIVAADISTWYEMAPSQNVTIAGNRFENCCTENSPSNYGVISVKCSDDANYTVSNYKIYQNIKIDNNIIQNSPTTAVFVSSTDTLSVCGNTLQNVCTNPSADKTTAKYPIAFVNCSNVDYDGIDDENYLYKYKCE